MKSYPLSVEAPKSYSYVKRNIPNVTVEQRERALKATHYNEFAFPAGMLTVDMLSDSGTTAMTDVQWSTMFLGDEAYGRNKGYYVLLDAFRDVFERGDNQKRVIDLVRTDCQDIDKMMNEMYLCEYEGGLFNGGFDTTEGNIKQMGSTPRNCFNKQLLWEVPEGGKYEKNPFKGNMDTKKLEALIEEAGPENVPLVYTTITNNTVCGQPVSMTNIRESSSIAHKYGIPYMLDAARWAENCYSIKVNEDGYEDKSIFEIAKEMFSYCDGFTASLKKDGHSNMGGILAFRDRGLFWKNFSDFDEAGNLITDVGILLKVKQISCYGNDSYGGMSGHDIMALAAGLYECGRFEYLQERVGQCEYLAQGFYKNGIKGVVLPAGGHGVYINMDEFFDGKRGHESFAGAGFSLELIRRYGIRVSPATVPLRLRNSCGNGII